MQKRVFGFYSVKDKFQVVLLPVFAALICCYYYFSNYSMELNRNYNGIISWASMENLDVAARVGLYFNLLGICLVVFLFVFFIFLFLRKRVPDMIPELDLLNYTGLIGILLLIYAVFDPQPSAALNFVYGFMGLVVTGMLLRSIRKNKLSHSYSLSEYYVWCFITGFLIYIILDNLVLYLGGDHIKTSFWLIFGFACLALIISSILISRNNITFYAIAAHARVLLFLALFSFVNNEVVFSLNQHGVYVNPLLVLIAGYVFILTVFVLWRIFKRTDKKHKPRNVFSNVYFPLSLVIIGLYAYAQGFLPHTNEMFETANPANAVLRSFRFGEIPFFDYIHSHMLSETFFGFLYVLINGFNGTMDFMAYDFLHFVIFTLLAYYFLKKITSQPLFSFLVCLLFPFVNVVFCEFLSYGLSRFSF